MVSSFSRKDAQELNFWSAEAACGAQVSVDKGSTSRVTNTDIVLSLGNKVRTNLF
jgi:hypothetical protein